MRSSLALRACFLREYWDCMLLMTRRYLLRSCNIAWSMRSTSGPQTAYRVHE